jgi:hypothetical protein
MVAETHIQPPVLARCTIGNDQLILMLINPDLNNAIFWDVTPCGCRTDICEEHITYIIRVTKIGELGTTFAVTKC